MSAEREVDLLVVGAGPAGMAAALIAALEGLDVLLVEKSDQVGGTGATSAGTLWIPGNHQSRAAGFNDSAEQAEIYLHALIGQGANRDLIKAYLQTGPAAIDYLEARTDVQFLPCGKHPDYRNNMPGAAVAGRAIVAKPFDGRLLGRDFRRVRPPIQEFMLLGGMMVGKEDIPRLIGRFHSLANFFYSARLFARYLADRLRHPRGTRITMGNALLARLFYSLRRRAVPILFEAAIVDVIGSRAGVTGARLKVAGQELIVKTRKGVVLATGGYAHNKALREKFMPQVRKAPVKKLDDLRSPLRYLLGQTRLEKEFSGLSLAPDVKPADPGNIVLRGVPKGMEDRINEVLLEVTPDWQIRRLVISEGDGAITQFRFADQKENVAIPDQRFKFSPPPGVETVEATEISQE